MSTPPSAPPEIERSFFPSWEDMDNIRGRGPRDTREGLRQLRRRGERGRPPGSKGRAQQKFAAYFIAKFGDPHDMMGEIMAMPIDVLIEQMEVAQGGDAKHKPVRAIDAMRLKIDCADRIAPYVRGKQPISIEVNERRDLVLLVPGLNIKGDADVETMRAAIEEHGLGAIDPETQELLLLPSARRVEDIPTDDDDDDA